jgi:rubrerythrin
MIRQHTVREGVGLTVIQGTEESYAPLDPPPAPSPSKRPRAELRCLDCGYGAVTSSDEIRCPMCGGETWDFAEWRPFSS